MNLWQKNISPDSAANTSLAKMVERFTVGRDQEMDQYLAAFDVLGSLAHTQMLESIGLLTREEWQQVRTELIRIYHQAGENRFQLEDGVEDIHSQIELLLTASLGETGKKIHSARSRNDQVLVDIKLFLRHELTGLVQAIMSFFDLLQAQSEKHKNDLLPGYTHLQLAMPSSFGLWFGAYAESLVDDMITLKAAFDIVNKNPLGSAAGYGSSFPVNRAMTTELLGFDELNFNVVYAQMGRGRTERIVAQALANVADTLARLSMDCTLYLNQNFGFISFPPELTTGSSIMPHKKNPDVFELIRAHCNQLKALPNEIMLMTTNLPSGYHRDLQLLKVHLFPAFNIVKDCIRMAALMLEHMTVRPNILDDEKYQYLFTVEEVNKLVMQGVAFRDAYRIVGQLVEKGEFKAPPASERAKGSHEGSIGRLCTAEIKASMDRIIATFPFAKIESAISRLL